MLDRSRTPSISVTIGRRECLYDAFITTAPAKLDLPATITLLADTLLPLLGYLIPCGVLAYYLMNSREIANPT